MPIPSMRVKRIVGLETIYFKNAQNMTIGYKAEKLFTTGPDGTTEEQESNVCNKIMIIVF